MDGNGLSGGNSFGNGREILVASLSLYNLLGQLPVGQLEQPTADDLAETVEVQFTDEIAAIAASLDHNPVKIYEYVRNNYDFEPTHGSIKGAVGAYWEKSGNAFDLASLLIALFRVSGIPARYEYGTVELPIEQVMNWVGVDNPEAAGTLMSSGGIPATTILVNGEPTSVRFEHVWVKALVDYTPSRGAVNLEEDRWIRLDPSFKQYEIVPGPDYKNAFVQDAQGFVDNLQAQAQTGQYSITGVSPTLIQNKIDQTATQVSNYVNNQSVEELRNLIGYERKIIKAYGLLPCTQIYNLNALIDEYAEIPDSMRHRIVFEVGDIDDFGFRTAQFSYSAFIPALASKSIALTYKPADDSSRDYLMNRIPTPIDGETQEEYLARMPGSLNASVVRLLPELRVDGAAVATGGSNVGMGYDQYFDMTFQSPGGYNNATVDNVITAGTYNAVVLNLGRISEEFVNTRKARMEAIEAQLQGGDTTGLTGEDVFGEMLYAAGLKYWGQVNFLEGVAEKITGVAATRLPSEGIFSYNLSVIWGGLVFPTPQTVGHGGFGTDVDHNTQAVVSLSGNPDDIRSYLLLTGMNGSFMEASVYDQLLNDADELTSSGTSAAHIISLANSQGIPVYAIDSTNVSEVLPLLQVSSSVKSAVQSAVNAGNIVVIPEQQVTIDGWWTGTGYVVTNPTTGAGAYMISGGYAGGGFRLPPLHPAILFIFGALLTALGILASVPGGIALAIASILVGVYDLLSSIGQILDDPNLCPAEKDMIIGMLTTFFLIGAIVAVVGIFFGGVLGFVAVAMLWSFLSIVAGNIILSMAPMLASRRAGSPC